MSAESEVLQANSGLYSALTSMLNGNLEPLETLWEHGANVSCINPAPAGQTLRGWDQVLEGFKLYSKMASAGQASGSDAVAQIYGDLAYVTCLEHANVTLGGQSVAFVGRASNVFRRGAGGWKMIHHHTDLQSDVQAVVDKLMAAQARRDG
jgi:ketosteroid isomerase-like protein